MKTDEQIQKLSQNPFYKLSEEEKTRLDSLSRTTAKVTSESEDSKKKQSQSARGNAAVKETGKLEKHSSDPVSE